TDPLGTANADITIANDNGTVGIWGGLLITTNFTALNAEGIYTNAQVFVKINTTNVEKSVTLQTTTGPVALDLLPQHFSFFINGVATFQVQNHQVFALSGTLDLEISPMSLTIFVQASLLLGESTANPIITFNATGLIYVQFKDDNSDHNNVIHAGFAAK